MCGIYGMVGADAEAVLPRMSPRPLVAVHSDRRSILFRPRV